MRIEIIATNAIMPAEEQWKQIQEIRERHDKAYQRWMPHINLLYPFVSEDQFSYAANKTERGLRDVKPFTVRFEDFGYFDHGRSNTLYLKPKVLPPGALNDLQAKLVALFPQCTDLESKGGDGFTPHLTVGQFVGKIAVERQHDLFKQNFVPIEFQVTHVHIISRTATEPFVIKYSVPLGHTESSPMTGTISLAPQIALPSTSTEPMEIDSEIVDDDLRKVLVRFKQWLKNQHSMKKLPKTKYGLLSATKNICSIQYKCSDVEKIYNVLLQEAYFQVLEKEQKVTYLKPPSHLLRRKPGGNLSNEEWALERCREWVYADGNSPGTVSALKNCLNQLLLKKETVDQRSVLNYFEKKGTLVFDESDNVKYVL